MSKVDVISPSVNGDLMSRLVETRSALAQGVGKTGELIKAYAETLSMVYDIRGLNGEVLIKWYDAKGKDAKGIKQERDMLKALIVERGIDESSIHTYWQRVKKASGYTPTGNTVVSDGIVDIDEKTKAELKTIINRIFKGEEDSNPKCDKASEVKGLLMDAYGFLGGNVDDLG